MACGSCGSFLYRGMRVEEAEGGETVPGFGVVGGGGG